MFSTQLNVLEREAHKRMPMPNVNSRALRREIVSLKTGMWKRGLQRKLTENRDQKQLNTQITSSKHCTIRGLPCTPEPDCKPWARWHPTQVTTGINRCHTNNLVLYSGASSPELPEHWLPGLDTTSRSCQEMRPHHPLSSPLSYQPLHLYTGIRSAFWGSLLNVNGHFVHWKIKTIFLFTQIGWILSNLTSNININM